MDPIHDARRQQPQHLFLIGATIVALAACGPTDEGDSATSQYGTNPEFSHPARYLFREFDRASDVDLAFVLRSLETSVESNVDFESEELIDRSPSVEALQVGDIEDVEHPNGDPGECLTVSMAARSNYTVERHATAALQTDQTPGDPSTPDHNVRTFLDATELCFGDRSCAVLKVENELTRSTVMFDITLTERVDYRWVDLGLPDPSAVEVDADAVNNGEPRWAMLSHSWLPERATNTDGNSSFEQAYSVGVWIPGAATSVVPVLRYTASWTQTELAFALDDTTMRQFARSAIQEAYDAQEIWLETLP